MTATIEDTIELRVTDIAQLFDTLDPYPFPERDLNRDAEEYIVGWARELAPQNTLRVVIHHPNTPHQQRAFLALREAMPSYFGSRSVAVQRDLNELLRVGRRSLLVGVATLAACLLLAQLAGRLPYEAPFNSLVEESFLILGWVANWRPLEIFLYDWWPLARKRDLYRRIARAHIEALPYAI